MGKRLYSNVSEAIESRVIYIPEVSCWFWGGVCNWNGYGVLKLNRKMAYAHRVMFEKHFGPIPDGMLICHTCDTPQCVNPDHLFLGTPQDNMSDKVSKNRQSRGEKHALTFKNSTKFKSNHPRGERHGLSKLSDVQRVEILESVASGETHESIAARFHVHPSTISHTKRKWIGGKNVLL